MSGHSNKRTLSPPQSIGASPSTYAAKKHCQGTPSIRSFFSPVLPKVQTQPPQSSPNQLKDKKDREQQVLTPTRVEISHNIADQIECKSLENVHTPQRSRISQKINVASPVIRDDSGRPQQGSDHVHAHLSYDFLKSPKRRDIKLRLPDHPEYDETTLHVPECFLKSQTPALRQWWQIKQKNMDAVIFFKMGKFYEFFNEDAVTAVENLDLIYMKAEDGKPAHAGFPEVSFPKYASILVNKGFKIVRVEQTETPAMMEERCAQTGKRGKDDKVVKREVCQVTTRGTQMMGVSDCLFQSAQNNFLLVLCESKTDDNRANVFGVCFTDVTTSKIYLGQFEDDSNLSNLNMLLAHHCPVEVLYKKEDQSVQCHRTLFKTGARISALPATNEIWNIKRALAHFKTNNVFVSESGNFEWPESLREFFESVDENNNLLSAEPRDTLKFGLDCLAALAHYLNKQQIGKQVMQGSTFVQYVPPLAQRLLAKQPSKYQPMQQPVMVVDHVAFRNLEVLEDSSGNSQASLLSCINHCKTHFGQRLLKNWLCAPLCDIKQINNRLDAVEELTLNKNQSLMNEIDHVLGQTPDLERMLSKIKSQCFKSDSEARAIMFDGDQYSKAKISSFLNLLTNFRRLQKFVTSASKSVQACESHVLRRLLSFTTNDGMFPDYSSILEYFDNAFDHKKAQQTGKIVPAPGVVKEYDECEAAIGDVTSQLDDYLEIQKQLLKCNSIEYFGSAKMRYQLQVPDAYCKRIPDDYRIETTRKGVKRYYTPFIDKHFALLTTYEEEQKRIYDNIMSEIFQQFARKIKLWSAAIECIACLDVLQSMASFVRSLRASGIEICRPKFLTNQDQPIISYREGRHPVLAKANLDYIANDLLLDDRLILLTGANMGGKSTLMRQTALLVILAQMGCYVPASSLELTPVDRIFSRLGASDRLLEGESTFYTELTETSSMLRYATRNSLLLLDELGRGTSTYDGTAIAYAVTQEIKNKIRCRCLFSTHYHSLVIDFADSVNVRLAHMSCKIERDSDDIDADPLKENITFLYKLADGPASRSYGFNVAKLANISDKIIRDAYLKAQEIELGSKVLMLSQKETSCDPNIDNSELMKRVLDAVLSS